jgi:GAF domain-containing protein
LGEALNALADESDRSRAADQHGEWMRRLAHDVGLRIRDGLDADTVVRTAVGELGSSFGVDRVILRLAHGDRLAPLSAEWHEIDVAPLGRRTLDSLADDDSTEWPESLWAAGKVFALVDLDVSSGTAAAEPLRHLARDDGARSALLVPVGAGAELLGTLTLLQMGHSRPWSPAETIAVQAIAADLGRSLRHALLYAQERLVVQHPTNSGCWTAARVTFSRPCPTSCARP